MPDIGVFIMKWLRISNYNVAYGTVAKRKGRTDHPLYL
jgi:hypothetical protein